MTRHLRRHLAVGLLATLGSFVRPANAQTVATPAPATRWSVFITTGSMMPVGTLQDALRSAPLTAAQFSWLARPHVALVGTLGWARSRDLLAAGAPKVDVVTADVGAELRSDMRALGSRTGLSGFTGAGLGIRRYDSRAVNTDALHHETAYATLGGDLRVRRVGLRVEVRDYVGGFTPVAGTATGTRTVANDVVVMTTLHFYRRAFGVR